MTENGKTMDTLGRSWAKLSSLRDGDRIELDDGFDCINPGLITIHADENKRLYFNCGDGKHYLDCQADDGEHCVGCYHG
jgi:hypothetical protein